MWVHSGNKISKCRTKNLGKGFHQMKNPAKIITSRNKIQHFNHMHTKHELQSAATIEE